MTAQRTFLALLAGIALLDAVFAGVFAALTGRVQGLAPLLTLSVTLLGGVNVMGGLVLFSPIQRYLSSCSSMSSDRVADRVRALPRLAALWAFGIGVTQGGAILYFGLNSPLPTNIGHLEPGFQVATVTWFIGIYAGYFAFYTYFATTSFVTWLRGHLYKVRELNIPAAGGSIRPRVLAALAALTVAPGAVILMDLTAFTPVRAAQGLEPIEAVVADLGVTLVAAGVCFIFLGRTLTRPLAMLERGMARVHGGELDIVLPIPADNEFGELSQTFNAMMQRLARADGDLMRQNEALIAQRQQIASLQTKTESAFLTTVQLLSRASGIHDSETHNHILRVGEYARYVATALGQSDGYVDEIGYSAQLHDVGKLLVDPQVMKKRGSLTAAEWTEMKRHTLYGHRILSESDDMRMAAEIALSHHEKWDGSGYPYGLAGRDIPLAARIVALADVYDALRSPRPYKEGFSHAFTVQIMTQGDDRLDPAGHFDPELLKLFEVRGDAFAEIYDRLADQESDPLVAAGT